MSDGPERSAVSGRLSPPTWLQSGERQRDAHPDPVTLSDNPKITQSNPESILTEAAAIVAGARRAAYGKPIINHRAIARLWQAFLDNKAELAPGPLTPQEVAELMILLKIARLQQTPDHRDSACDGVGYFACIEDMWTAQPQ